MVRKIAITEISSTLAKSILPFLLNSPEQFYIRGIDVQKYNGPFSDKIEMIQADIRDKAALKHTFDRVDVVIHLAFIVIGNVPKKFEEIYDININGSKAVFECAAEAKVSQIIYFSSVAAYGMSDRTPNLIDENTPLEGQFMKDKFYYAYCKGMIEIFLDDFEQKNPSLCITRFRPHVITGPNFVRNTDNLKRVIEKLVTKKKTVYLIQSGNSTRHIIQLTHEEDLARLTLFAIQSSLQGSFNVAGEPLDYAEFLLVKAKDVKFVPHHLVSKIVGFLSHFSHKYRVLNQWLSGSKIQVIMKCEKLNSINYPHPLCTTQKALEIAVEEYKIQQN